MPPIPGDLGTAPLTTRYTRPRGCRPLPHDGPDGGLDGLLTINVAVLLAVVVVLRLRRRTHSRSRFDEKMTVVIVLALGIILAPTEVGQGIARFLGQLVSGVSQASQ